jgi:hypothetical protein
MDVYYRLSLPISFLPYRQVTLPHQPQYLPVVDNLSIVLELLGDTPITIPGQLQADGFNAVDNVRIGLG